jgi:ribosomal protein S18 acetylase RimI-like enzyme
MTNETPVGVYMSRENLESLPQYPLPEGFRFRMLRAGDEEAWANLLEISGLTPSYDAAVNQWREEFENHPEEVQERCVLVEAPDGSIVGTATTWFEDRESFCGRGRLHWVGVDPSCQGKGIGKALVAETLRVMATMDKAAMLQTESHRIAAISIYLEFGFVPEIKGEKDKAAWIEIGRKLSLPALYVC